MKEEIKPNLKEIDDLYNFAGVVTENPTLFLKKK